ncbi:UDP-N-acetylmuramoyl-tripeptide--D-alanyl-D-alanine ligase [Clostridiales bacterium]|nr:UDP-N-acetylmuramoyl-tripeptide--D-alanyl-D-alanine ligase [Clostridiales bacterium]
MEAIRTSQVATFANGCLLGSDTIITYITTDSRDVREGCLFAAIKGDRFDGHSFINQAYAAGAACVLSQTEVSIPAGKSAIIVGDTRKALLNIAGGYRRMFNIPVVAITGSVGKTTTKDIVAEVLSKRFNVLKTIGNFNNDIGVPKTIFSLGIEHNAAVIEMGMNHKGEIDTLARSVSPDIGIITNVGVSHIENLGSREGILDAKCEMFSHIDPLLATIVLS